MERDVPAEWLDVRDDQDRLRADTLRAATGLGLEDSLLQFILSVDADVLEDLMHGRLRIDPACEAGRRALLLVRLHSELGRTFGSIERARAQWLDVPHVELGHTPRDGLATADGISTVLELLQGVPTWRASQDGAAT